MVDINELKPGMEVKIVDEWNDKCNQNLDGLMDRYLGTVMTVKAVFIGGRNFVSLFDCSYRGLDWMWNQYALDCIVDSNENDFEPATMEELFTLMKSPAS